MVTGMLVRRTKVLNPQSKYFGQYRGHTCNYQSVSRLDPVVVVMGYHQTL